MTATAPCCLLHWAGWAQLGRKRHILFVGHQSCVNAWVRCMAHTTTVCAACVHVCACMTLSRSTSRQGWCECPPLLMVAGACSSSPPAQAHARACMAHRLTVVLRVSSSRVVCRLRSAACQAPAPPIFARVPLLPRPAVPARARPHPAACTHTGGDQNSVRPLMVAEECLKRGWRSVLYVRRGHGISSLLPYVGEDDASAHAGATPGDACGADAGDASCKVG